MSIVDHPTFEPACFHGLRFGHRGGSHNGPENTLALLTHNVLQHGMRAAEIDLQLTLDGHLVLFHDETISRVLDAEIDAKVSELTLSQLLAFPYRDRRLGEVYVSTLEELLVWFQNMHDCARIPVMLELDFKPHGAQTALAVHRLMTALTPVNRAMQGDLEKNMFISSFFPDVLREIRKYSKNIVLGFAFNAHSEEHPFLGRVAACFAWYVARKFDCRIIAPDARWLSASRVSRWKRRGYLVSSYPADTAAERAYLDSFGIAYATSLPTRAGWISCADVIRPEMGVQVGKGKFRRLYSRGQQNQV